MTMDEDEKKPKLDIRREAIHGTLWAYLSFLAGKGLTFVSTIILARLLVPEQFGLVGYCLIAIQYLDVLNTVGMDTALISRRDRVEEASNAAFVIAIGMGLSLYAFAWSSAPLIANFFREESVIPLFRVLAIVLPINAVAVVPRALIQRELRFRDKIIPDVSRNFAKGSVAVVMAWQGFGVWSLIYGQIIGEITATIIYWFMMHWRPTFTFDRQVTLEMLSFGYHIVLVGLLGALQSNVDYLLVGRVLGAAALGYYTIAYRIPELIIRNLNFVVAKVAHPVLSRIQSEADQLRSVYASYLRYIALFTFPAGVGLALIASPFIRTFYTEEWVPSIVVMQFIALSLAITSIGHVPGVFYKATNRPDILNKLSIIKLPFAIFGLWYGTRWGITGVAVSQLVLAIFYVVIDSLVVSRLVSFSLLDMFQALKPAIVGSAIMALVVFAVATLFSPTGVVALLLLSFVGAVVYLGALAVVSSETMAQASSAVRAAIVRS